MSNRTERMRFKMLPNGNMRAYLDDYKKTGVSEWQFISPNNIGPTITTAHIPKILLLYEQQEIKHLDW